MQSAAQLTNPECSYVYILNKVIYLRSYFLLSKRHD